MNSAYKFLILLIISGSVMSCKKYLDINENPNAPTQPPINGLLTNVTQNSALNTFRVAQITNNYVQYFASPNAASPSDVYEPIDASGTWTALYDNMTDIYDLERFAKERGATQYQGVAKVLMAMDLHLIHNLWGAAPYSEAFTGNDLTPAFDNAQAIYQKTISLLDEGITLLGQPGSTVTIPTSATNNPDLIHKGNTAAWIRTARALKARLLNQLSKTPQYNANAIFTELAGAYTSNAQDAFITTFAVRNPWNQVALNNQNLLLDGWLSEYYVDLMDGTTLGYMDPRLPLTASLTRFNDYRGTRNGKGRTGSGTTKDESYVSLTGTLSSPGSPLYIITYDELKFIEAEAALRSGDRPRAHAAYLAAINANMTRMGVASSAAATYLANPAVSSTVATLSLTDIFREKYKALFLMPVTWDDARRFNYGYPSFQMPLNAVTSTFIRRLVYPSIEESRNGANTPDIADVTQRLWWDQ